MAFPDNPGRRYRPIIDSTLVCKEAKTRISGKRVKKYKYCGLIRNTIPEWDQKMKEVIQYGYICDQDPANIYAYLSTAYSILNQLNQPTENVDKYTNQMCKLQTKNQLVPLLHNTKLKLDDIPKVVVDLIVEYYTPEDRLWCDLFDYAAVIDDKFMHRASLIHDEKLVSSLTDQDAFNLICSSVFKGAGDAIPNIFRLCPNLYHTESFLRNPDTLVLLLMVVRFRPECIAALKAVINILDIRSEFSRSVSLLSYLKYLSSHPKGHDLLLLLCSEFDVSAKIMHDGPKSLTRVAAGAGDTNPFVEEGKSLGGRIRESDGGVGVVLSSNTPWRAFFMFIDSVFCYVWDTRDIHKYTLDK
jgi:hypothetical protein